MKIIKGKYANIAILENDQCISRFVEMTGKLDHDDSIMTRILPYIKQGAIVVDVGAYIGDHTIAYAKKVGNEGAVFAFEPSQPTFECLEYNLKGYKDTVLCFNMALGKEAGKCSLQSVETNYGMNYINSDSGEIEVRTLDSFNLGGLDFLKIDCEGYELDVLEGAKETINKYRPIMFIEINELALSRRNMKRLEIFAWLKENNYLYRNIYSHLGLNDYQMDIICEPNKK